MDRDQEVGFLKQQAASVTATLESIKRRLKELEAGSESKP
jgi:hypothetical protein